MKIQMTMLFVMLVSAVITPPALADDGVSVDDGGLAVSAAPKDPNDHAKDISKKFDDLHGNLNKFLDTAISSDQVFEPDQIEFLRNEKARSQKSKDRLDKENGLKGVGRKNDFNKKNKDKDDEYDDGAFEDFESSLDDLNAMLVKADDELKNGNKAKALFVQANADPNGVNHCQELVDASISLGVAASVVRGLAIAADTTFNAVDCGSKQTIWGFNASSVAIVFAVATGVLDMTATGLEIADEWTAEDMKADCFNQINTNVNHISAVSQGTAAGVDELNQKIEAMRQELDALKELMNERMDMLEILLNTPQGQRPTFPGK